MHCGFIFGKNMDSLSCVTSLYPNEIIIIIIIIVIIKKRRRKKEKRKKKEEEQKKKKKKKKNFIYLRNSRTTVETKKFK